MSYRGSDIPYLGVGVCHIEEHALSRSREDTETQKFPII